MDLVLVLNKTIIWGVDLHNKINSAWNAFDITS